MSLLLMDVCETESETDSVHVPAVRTCSTETDVVSAVPPESGLIRSAVFVLFPGQFMSARISRWSQCCTASGCSHLTETPPVLLCLESQGEGAARAQGHCPSVNSGPLLFLVCSADDG